MSIRKGNTYTISVFSQYSSQQLTVNTQASFGNVSGEVGNNTLTFPDGVSFGRPTAGDIFSNSTGPFATGSNAEVNAIIPRLAAAWNRSTLLLSNSQPNGVQPSQYYQNATTNVS